MSLGKRNFHSSVERAQTSTFAVVWYNGIIKPLLNTSTHLSCDLRLDIQRETECTLVCGTWGPTFAHLASHRCLFFSCPHFLQHDRKQEIFSKVCAQTSLCIHNGGFYMYNAGRIKLLQCISL